MISVILWCLLIFSIICLIILISVYLFEKELTVQAKEGYPCLTFEQFKSFYDISPDKFYLHTSGVEVTFKTEHTCVNPEGPGIPIYYPSYRDTESYYFKTNADLSKYERWRERKEKEEAKKRREERAYKSMEKLTNLMEEDINKKIEEINAQIESAAKAQEEILDRMKKESEI